MSRRYQFDVRVRIRTQVWQKYLFGRAFTCKDGYSDTMGIGITVLDFYQKSLKTAVPQTFLKKAHR